MTDSLAKWLFCHHDLLAEVSCWLSRNPNLDSIPILAHHDLWSEGSYQLGGKIGILLQVTISNKTLPVLLNHSVNWDIFSIWSWSLVFTAPCLASLHRGDHKQKFYWGHKEILIPVYKNMADALKKHPEVDVLINFASLRSAYDSTVETMSFPQVGFPIIHFRVL